MVNVSRPQVNSEVNTESGQIANSVGLARIPQHRLLNYPGVRYSRWVEDTKWLAFELEKQLALGTTDERPDRIVMGILWAYTRGMGLSAHPSSKTRTKALEATTCMIVSLRQHAVDGIENRTEINYTRLRGWIAVKYTEWCSLI